MVQQMSKIREHNKSVKFKAKIRSQNRITVPKRLVDLKEGDEVIVVIYYPKKMMGAV